MVAVMRSPDMPIGLLEIDESGTVRYFKPERGEETALSAAEIIGRNVFTYVIPTMNCKEFEHRLSGFRLSGAQAASFNFSFNFNHTTVPVRVLLAHVRDHTELASTALILIHIRRA